MFIINITTKAHEYLSQCQREKIKVQYVPVMCKNSMMIAKMEKGDIKGCYNDKHCKKDQAKQLKHIFGCYFGHVFSRRF